MQREYNNYLLSNDIDLNWIEYSFILFIIEQNYTNPVSLPALINYFSSYQKIPIIAASQSFASLKTKGFLEENQIGIVAGNTFLDLIKFIEK